MADNSNTIYEVLINYLDNEQSAFTEVYIFKSCPSEYYIVCKQGEFYIPKTSVRKVEVFSK